MTTTTLHHRILHQKRAQLGAAAMPWKLTYLLAGLFCLAMLVAYIFFINQLTQGAYLIKNYQKEITMLSKENVTLQANFAETSFLGLAEQKTQELSFQKTANVKYLQILQNSLAEAK